MNMTGLAMYLGDGTKQVTDLNNLLFSQHAVSPHLQLVCLFAYLAASAYEKPVLHHCATAVGNGHTVAEIL